MVSTKSQPATLLGWMEALADPIRLRLLRLLEREELGVVELCDVLQLPQSTVSRHLKVLADQRWARSRAQGTTRLYRTILDELDAAARKIWLVAREQTDAWPAVAQDRLRLERRLRERQTDAAAFFEGAAARWDKLRGELYGRHFGTAAALALLPPDWVVADLGCGTGEVAACLAASVGRVIGVDGSPAMLRAARRRTAGMANVELTKGQLDALPLPSGACDAALMILALTYVPDVPAALAEARRILRPGGRLAVVDLLPHDRDDFRREMGQVVNGFEPAAVAAAIGSAGFERASVRPLPPEANVKGPALWLATATATAARPAGD